MAQVTVEIAGKTYRMACDNGQEPHLIGLAGRLDGLIDELRRTVGEIGDQRLTVMSALTLLDQLADAEQRIKGLEADVATLRDSRERQSKRQGEIERRQSDLLIETARTIEMLADALEADRDPLASTADSTADEIAPARQG